MKPLANTDAILGLVCVLFALVLLFFWIPTDTETSIIERVRGRVVIGDALAPTIAGAVLFLAGFLLIVATVRRGNHAQLSLTNIYYLITLAIILVVSLFLMRWTGPFVVDAIRLMGVETSGYRELRDTVPWKYLGYLAGGSFLVTSMISLVERRLCWQHLLVAFAAALALALVYDLPFKSLVLPPNGDV